MIILTALFETSSFIGEGGNLKSWTLISIEFLFVPTLNDPGPQGLRQRPMDPPAMAPLLPSAALQSHCIPASFLSVGFPPFTSLPLHQRSLFVKCTAYFPAAWFRLSKAYFHCWPHCISFRPINFSRLIYMTFPFHTCSLSSVIPLIIV